MRTRRPLAWDDSPWQLIWAIACTGRTGSTWFCDLIASTGLLGKPAEYLLDWPRWREQFGLSQYVTREEYLAYLVARQTTPNGAFSVKGTLHELRAAFDCFGDIPCVWLRRQDRIQQAVSFYVAEAGGRWVRRGGVAGGARPEFHPQPILRWLREIERREQAWIDFFRQRRMQPLVIYYEDLCRDPLGGVRAAARHVGVDPSRIVGVHSTMEIVRDDVTQAWAEQMRRLLAEKSGQEAASQVGEGPS